KACATARIENFLYWMLRTYAIKKTSTVTTYWRQLSLLHIVCWNCRIGPHILKQSFVVWLFGIIGSIVVLDSVTFSFVSYLLGFLVRWISWFFFRSNLKPCVADHL